MNAVEYTRGQMIRAEAVMLRHQADALARLSREEPGLGDLEPVARRLAGCVSADEIGNPVRINRNRQFYEEMTRELRRAKERTEFLPGTPGVRESRVVMEKCKHHCIAITAAMLKASAGACRPWP